MEHQALYKFEFNKQHSEYVASWPVIASIFVIFTAKGLFITVARNT